MARREHKYSNDNIPLSADCMSGFNLWKFIKLSNYGNDMETSAHVSCVSLVPLRLTQSFSLPPPPQQLATKTPSKQRTN